MKYVASIVPKPKVRRSTSTSRILEFHGNQDGIRFGMIMLAGVSRTFLHDRLSGKVRIYRHVGSSDTRSEDTNAERAALAKALLDARWAEERQVGPDQGGSPQRQHQTCESAVDDKSQIAGVKIS